MWRCTMLADFTFDQTQILNTQRDKPLPSAAFKADGAVQILGVYDDHLLERERFAGDDACRVFGKKKG